MIITREGRSAGAGDIMVERLSATQMSSVVKLYKVLMAPV